MCVFDSMVHTCVCIVIFLPIDVNGWSVTCVALFGLIRIFIRSPRSDYSLCALFEQLGI